MNTLVAHLDNHAIDVDFTENNLHIILADGRELSAPLEWFPRLRDAKKTERNHWRLIGNGIGIHWPDIDEDVSVSSLITGKD